MKRKIKFRGKCKDTGKWVFGNLIQDVYETTVYIFQKIDKESNSYEVDKNTVGQFTGLLDVDKQNIYEGDIVNFLYDGEPAVVTWSKQLGIWCLLFNDDPHGLLSAKPLGKWLHDAGGFKVVGNVFDNPIESHVTRR